MMFGWLWKRLHAQVDELRATTVTRSELSEVISDMRTERREMHRENQDALSAIHKRVDALWERGG